MSTSSIIWYGREQGKGEELLCRGREYQEGEEAMGEVEVGWGLVGICGMNSLQR